MENRLKTIFKASVVGIIVNIALGIFKALVGIISNSIAITMDAVNNFTDAGSSLITVLSSYFGAKDPDKKHPFGYGRTEYLGTLLIACLILYAGVTAFVESVKKIIEPETANYSALSLLIISVAVLAKAGLAFYVSHVGKQVNSDSLVAAGKDAIGDIAISIATLAAAIIFIVTHISLEAWLGAFIAVFIIKMGIETLKETIDKLLGTGGDAALVRDVKKAITEHEGVQGAYDLVLHNYGPDAYLASVHIAVDDTVSISSFDTLTREIQNDILARFGIYMSAVGVYATNTHDAAVIEVREAVKAIALDTTYVNQFHGFYVDMTKKTMHFDLVISFDAKDRRQVHDDVVEKVQKAYPGYVVTAGLDTDYNEI